MELYEGTSQKYTKEAFEFDKEINGALGDIFKKYLDKGYSIRDIEYFILTCTVTQATRIRLKLRSQEKHNVD